MRAVAPRAHWFTSDLRSSDNPALAGSDVAPLVGVFVLDPAALRRARAAPRRVAFLHACLTSLDADLRARGSRLVVVEGDPAVALPPLAARLGVRVVTHARNHEPAARTREKRVASALAADGVDVRAADATSVHAPGTLLTGTGTPFRVYGAFARAWLARSLPPTAPSPARWTPAGELADLGLPWPPAADGRFALPAAGESAACARLTAFLRRGLAAYPTRRDLPAVDGTSRLSYHLRFGTLSAAEACRRAAAAERADGARVWRRELAWRDFFAHLLHAFPHVAREPFRPLAVRWRVDDAGFRRWQEGTTGYPLVDAGMRELHATGFMHNRVRMVTASFLTRHLLLDWRSGEAHFMAELLDGQLAQNDGNWQWVAGTGADAQPFHRIFSPVRQGERFDPDGTYIRRWVPELARVPRAHVHAPWTLSPLERRAVCPDYPPPVVEHEVARARALAAFESARRHA
jgi:deoxyribodipyrimidine photo-lyase